MKSLRNIFFTSSLLDVLSNFNNFFIIFLSLNIDRGLNVRTNSNKSSGGAISVCAILFASSSASVAASSLIASLDLGVLCITVLAATCCSTCDAICANISAFSAARFAINANP